MRERSILFVFIGFLLILLIVSFVLGIIKVPSFYSLRVSYYSFLYKEITPVNIDDREKLQNLHRVTNKNIERKSVAKAESARCIACHGTMVEPRKAEELDHRKAKKPLHQAMLTLPQLDFQCTHCHKRVDLRTRDRSRVTIKVDRKFCAEFPCHNPPIMTKHGENNVAAGKKWIANHPKVAMQVGIFEVCRKCHVIGTELDICHKCHLKRGFRPSHHRVEYTQPINRIFPKIPRAETVTTKWKGYHFVFVRERLKEMGVQEVTPRTIPLDKVKKLTCPACHVLRIWCTKCHIKHAPTWLDPNAPSGKGHPQTVIARGTDYCFRCHDPNGSKCISCHTYVGQLIK